MQHPADEIAQVVNLMCCAKNPEVQKQTILKYFTHDASFTHPLCSVPSGTNSVNSILGIYQWYRIMSPEVPLKVNRVVYDENQGQIFLDITQKFHIRFSPFKPAPSRLVVNLTVVEHDGLYYISSQEDFYHTEDLFALVLPPLAPFVHVALRAGSIISNIQAGIFQLAFGIWRPASSGGKLNTEEDVRHIEENTKEG